VTKRIAVAGLGLIGGSLALGLRRARPDLEIVGWDPDPPTMAGALASGTVRSGDIAEAEVTFLAAPIPALPELLAAMAHSPAVVTDVASTKVKVLSWAKAAGVDLVGGHPMCGSEASGWQAADPDLFRGAAWILTRPEPKVCDLIAAVGAHPLIMEAALHDRLVAKVSHCAFMISVAYMVAAAGDGDWPLMAQMAGPGFRDLTRLAAGDPTLYQAIAGSNGAAMAQSMKDVELSLAQLRHQVETEDPGLQATFEKARAAREAWSYSRESNA
jgi:prephenate dehydrogenase